MKNKNNQSFTIIGEPFHKNKHLYQRVIFESGYETDARVDSITNGTIRDKYQRSLAGVGIIGNINTRDHLHEYKIWSNMMRRCYDPNDKGYKYYGKRGVSVCERWHRFDLFYNDMANLPGFNSDLFNRHELQLDKDRLSINAKIYSPSTCMWVSSKENQRQRVLEHNVKHQKYAVFPDGHIELIVNMTEFCNKYNLHRQNVNLCLTGKQKSTKGFRFIRKEQ